MGDEPITLCVAYTSTKASQSILHTLIGKLTIKRYSEKNARAGKNLKNIKYEEQLNEPKLLTLGERKIFNYFKYWLDVKRKRNIERERKRMKPKIW